MTTEQLEYFERIVARFEAATESFSTTVERFNDAVGNAEMYARQREGRHTG